MGTGGIRMSVRTVSGRLVNDNTEVPQEEQLLRLQHKQLIDRVSASNGAAGCRGANPSTRAPSWATSVSYEAGAYYPGFSATRDRGWEERADHEVAQHRSE